MWPLKTYAPPPGEDKSREKSRRRGKEINTSLFSTHYKKIIKELKIRFRLQTQSEKIYDYLINTIGGQTRLFSGHRPVFRIFDSLLCCEFLYDRIGVCAIG